MLIYIFTFCFPGNSFFDKPSTPPKSWSFIAFKSSTFRKRTWSERGWCRMERMARDLLRNDGILIQVQVASRPIIVPANTGGVGSASRAPGTGDFSVESDRPRVGRVMNRLMFNKLHSFLQTGTAWKKNTTSCVFWLKKKIPLFLVLYFVCFKTPSFKNTGAVFSSCKKPAFPNRRCLDGRRWLPQLSFLIEHATALLCRAWSGFNWRFSVRLPAGDRSFHRSRSFCSVSFLTWERLPKSTRAW